VHSSMKTLVVLALAAASPACGGPLPTADAPTQAAGTDAPDAATTSEAAAGTFHTITVTLCARDRDACRKAQGTPGEASYRIAFGGSVGTLRSREQATADLYRELRDRTALGTRLVAQRRHLQSPGGDAGPLAPAASPAAAASATPDPPVSDVLVDAARELIEAVDAEGGVTIDVAHGRPGCKVLLALAESDASTGRCLIKEPPRPGAHDTDAPRGREERFGK
jgi:hypothetical protein